MGSPPAKKVCNGNPKTDAYAALGTHGVLAVASMVPFVGCGAAIADVGLTGAEESGLLCGGELQTPNPGWRAVNVGLAVTGAALSCIPGIGTIFGGVKGAFNWFGGLFKGSRGASKIAKVATKAAASASKTVTHITTKAVASASKVVKATGAAKLSKIVAAPVTKIADLAAHHTAALTEAVKRATIAPVLVKVGRFTGASVATTSKVAVLTVKATATGGKEIEALVRNIGHAEPPHLPVPHEKPPVIHEVGPPRAPHEPPVVKAPKPHEPSMKMPDVSKAVLPLKTLKAVQLAADVAAGVTQYVQAKAENAGTVEDEEPLWEKVATVALITGLGYYTFRRPLPATLFS